MLYFEIIPLISSCYDRGVARIFDGGVQFFTFEKVTNITFVLNFYIFLDIKIDFASSLQHFSVKKII